MSLGYGIQTRNRSKIVQLTDRCVLVTAGMQSDAATLFKTLKYRLAQYEHQHGKQMTTEAIAQMLSNMLYGRRFFPYYTFNLLAGLDVDGVGAVYGYDAIGSYERIATGSNGSG
jgi:20S proteasome subunit beta 6